MVGAFLMKIIQFETFVSIGKLFISLVNLTIKFHFQKKSIHLFVTFAFLLFDSGFCLLLAEKTKRT